MLPLKVSVHSPASGPPAGRNVPVAEPVSVPQKLPVSLQRTFQLPVEPDKVNSAASVMAFWALGATYWPSDSVMYEPPLTLKA